MTGGGGHPRGHGAGRGRLAGRDVLTGAVSGLMAQRLEPVRAALIGCWLHGRAGELGGEDFPVATPAGFQSHLLAAAWQELEEQ